MYERGERVDERLKIYREIDDVIREFIPFG